MIIKELTQRQARWAEVLSQYDFWIIHCKGNENGQADTLSQWPDYEIKEWTPNPVILRLNEDGLIGYNQQILAVIFHIENNALKKKIIEETKKDKMIQEMLEESINNNKITTSNNRIIFMHNLIYIPKSMRQEIISMHHNSPVHRHIRTEKTAEQIARNYYFPNLMKNVQHYIKNCKTCIRDKATRHQPYSKMQSPDAPTYPWEWITVDFITQLPPAQNYNSITVIMDRLTKYIHLVPSKGTMTTADMAQIFLKHVITNHGMPQKITLDRDKLFMSKFWETLTKLMGIDHQLTTAYHLQANGQTEWMNQTIEQYLQHYISYEQDDWDKFLSMA